MLAIKQFVECLVHNEGLGDWTFNSCLGNLYADAGHAVGPHADNEACLDPDAPIVSMSFGSSRKFLFEPTHDNRCGHSEEILLSAGTALVMAGRSTQENYLHSVRRGVVGDGPRISLTFRVVRKGAVQCSGGAPDIDSIPLPRFGRQQVDPGSGRGQLTLVDVADCVFHDCIEPASRLAAGDVSSERVERVTKRVRSKCTQQVSHLVCIAGLVVCLALVFLTSGSCAASAFLVAGQSGHKIWSSPSLPSQPVSDTQHAVLSRFARVS